MNTIQFSVSGVITLIHGTLPEIRFGKHVSVDGSGQYRLPTQQCR